MTDYFNALVYKKPPEKDLDDLKTSVFALEQNADHGMDGFDKEWTEMRG